MSKLDDLINKFCPDGVEYHTLGEIAKEKSEKNKDRKVTEVRSVTNKNILVNPLEIFSSQVASDDTSNYKIVRFGDFTYNPARINIGSIAYHKETTPVIISPMYIVFSIDETKITQDFLLKYFLSSVGMTNICGKVEEGARFRMPFSSLSKIKIPIPPLDIQYEIVRILDKFTSLEAELEAELEARRKQYEYYRNSLLTFGDDVEWKTIGELCTVKVGGEPPENVSPIKDLNHPYPIWGNGKEIYGFTDSYIIEQDAVAISSIGANTGAVFFHTGMFTPIIRLKVLLPKENSLLSKYLFYACSRIEFNTKKSSVPNMSAEDVKRKKIPLPSLSEQQRIVNILDRFESLCNDITTGLPAEIEARHKQYEYYRDKLLTFKRKDT